MRRKIKCKYSLLSFSYLLLLEYKKGRGMERLAPKAHHIRPNPHIQDPMFGEVGKLPIQIEHSRSRSNDHYLLSSSVVYSILLGEYSRM